MISAGISLTKVKEGWRCDLSLPLGESLSVVEGALVSENALPTILKRDGLRLPGQRPAGVSRFVWSFDLLPLAGDGRNSHQRNTGSGTHKPIAMSASYTATCRPLPPVVSIAERIARIATQKPPKLREAIQ